MATVSLLVSGIAILSTLVLGVLMELDLGMAEPPRDATDIEERILGNFLVAEQRWKWQAWIEPLTALAFGSVLIAVPWLPDIRRSRTAVSAGLTIIVVNDLLDSAQGAAMSNARFTLDNGVTDSFAAFNVARFMIDIASEWIFQGGALVLAVGLGILAMEASKPRWRGANVLFALALAFLVFHNHIADDLFAVAYTLMTVAMIYWAMTAARAVGDA